jgi:hypothetical protein
MKKSKLNKLSKLIVRKFRKNELKSKPIREDIKFVEYDKDVSKKMKSLIVNIIKYKDNININLSESDFCISTPNIKRLKSSSNIKNYHSDEDYVEISVYKEGFSISKGYNKRSNYKDNMMFDELKPLIKSRISEINKENFIDIWDIILKESGVIRDNNLNNLFDE